MFWESSGVVGFDLGPLLEGQMRTAKLKSAYNSLIIGPRGFGALSLRWIQFASVLQCARSSLNYFLLCCHLCLSFRNGIQLTWYFDINVYPGASTTPYICKMLWPHLLEY